MINPFAEIRLLTWLRLIQFVLIILFGLLVWGGVTLVSQIIQQNSMLTDKPAASDQSKKDGSLPSDKDKDRKPPQPAAPPVPSAPSAVPAAPVSAYGPVPSAPPTTPYVTPDQFGAAGNGIRDDTAAVQAALDAASGKTMWIPANRTYLCSKMIRVSRDTTVKGADTTSILRFTWIKGTADPSSGGGSYIAAKTYGSRSANIALTNFKVVGNGDGNPTGVNSSIDYAGGISISLVNNLTMSRLEVMNTGGLGMSSISSQNVTITRNYVHNTGRGGIETFKKASIDVANVLVESNLIERTGDDAIGFNGLVPNQPIDKLITNAVARSNVINSWPDGPGDKGLGRGILINGVDGGIVANNIIFYSGGVNILLQGCVKDNCNATPTDWHNNNIQVINNALSRPVAYRGAGILINKVDNSTVTGNTFLNNKPTILNQGCTACTLQ